MGCGMLDMKDDSKLDFCLFVFAQETRRMMEQFNWNGADWRKSELGGSIVDFDMSKIEV